MFKKALYFGLTAGLAFLLSVPEDAEARKRRRRKVLRKWSISITNGYTFYFNKKNVRTADAAPGPGELFDGQMNRFFSSVEVARNFGRYEVGGRLQFQGEAFVSPFLKLNFVKNRRRKAIVPFLILGVSPSKLTGFYSRLGMNLFFNNRLSLSPFLGSYFWFKADENVSYIPSNFYGHGGLSASLFF